MNKSDTIKFEISPKSILIALGLIAGIFILVELKQVVLILFLSLIITSALRPLVEKLHTKRIPRGLVVIAIYLLVLTVLGLVAFFIVSSLAPQLAELSQNLPELLLGFLRRISEFIPAINSFINVNELNKDNLAAFIGGGIDTGTILQNFGRAFGFVSSAFELIVSVVSVVILSVYMLSRRESVLKQFSDIFPQNTKEKLYLLIPKVEAQLGAWLRGQITLMLIMGGLSWIGLTAIGIKFALPVAILIALLELIPNIGPAFGWTISTTVAIGSGAVPAQIILVFGWSIFIQQVEHLLLVPKIFQKVVGLDPVITILGIISFSILFGFAGVIIAVPVLAIVQIAWKHLKETKDSK
jgi:predicted PurR-regulated permease PerM